MTQPATFIGRAAAAAALALLAGSCGNSDPFYGIPGSQKLTVIVLVVDSLMPDEITPATTPNLDALKAGGTFYAESRSVFIAETIPNHVAMMTGVYPARNGVPSNEFLDFSVNPPEERDLSVPEKMTARTLFTWIDRRCRTIPVVPDIRTGATLSKKYLFEIFEGDAANAALGNDDPDVFNVPPDSYWNPQDSDAYIPSPSEHTPDVPTMDQALTQLPDVDFFFINLGDVDRLAHASGPDARNAAIADVDTQVGRLVTALQDAGRWERTVLFVVSDHGMDFSAPGPAAAISTQATLDALGACYTPMYAMASGEGSDSIYVLDRAAPLAQRQAALRAARGCLLGVQDCAALCPGATRPVNAGNIEVGWYNVEDPLDPAGTPPPSIQSRHANFGDLVLAAGDGGKFSEPNLSDPSGQIPGNHGHLVTMRNTFLVSGGSPWVKQGQVIAASVPSPGPLDRLPEQSEVVDIAPTVAWLMGLRIRNNEFPDYPQYERGFDGRILKEAFVQFDADPDAAPPSACGRFD